MSEERGRKKDRILFILQYLIKNTDDDHKVSQSELFDLCLRSGHRCERHAISNDINVLCSCDFDIIRTKIGRQNYYNYGCRVFDTAELRTLMDAVASCKSISERKTECLMKKISGLSSCHEADLLRTSVYTGGTAKAENNQVFLTVDVINQAINTGKKIAFQYYCYDEHRNAIPQYNGEDCAVSPYLTIWKDDRYYMIGWNDSNAAISSFRIDRMGFPRLLEEPAAVKPQSFDPNDYLCAFNRILGKGAEMDITLRCDNSVMNQIIDQFGSGFQYERADENHFRAKVHVNAGDPFWGWLFENAGRMTIESPGEAKRIYRERLNRALID